jgi:hypothetical protein
MPTDWKEEWRMKMLKLIDDTMEEWATAFDGPPEDQFSALEFLRHQRNYASQRKKKQSQK